MPSQEELRAIASMEDAVAREEALDREARYRTALGFPHRLLPYVFGADTARRLLFLTNWPPLPDAVVALPMLSHEQAARIGGAWEPVLMGAHADGTATALWRWIPDTEPEATP